MRKALLTAAVALAALASPSAAATHHHHHAAKHYNPISAAYTIAARYWHVQPCNGDITILRAAPPAAVQTPAFTVAEMWASWGAGTPFENSETAPQPFERCVITINPEAWPTEYFEAYTAWPEFAVQFIHEFGHLLGHEHSLDPTSVMFSGPLSAKPAVTGEYAPGWGYCGR